MNTLLIATTILAGIWATAQLVQVRMLGRRLVQVRSLKKNTTTGPKKPIISSER